MRIGCCATIDEAAAVRDAGFDFLEVNIQAVLNGDLDDAAWSAAAPDADRLPLPIEAANCLIPGRYPIVGPARDMGVLRGWMRRVAPRARRLGIERLVFGSGGARKRPDDVDEATATAQIEEFTRMAGEACGDAGVLLVIEHLRHDETNTINMLAEERALIEAVDHPAVVGLIDTYHYGCNGDDPDEVLALDGAIRHVHVAEPVGRVQPGAHGRGSADAFDFEEFFCLLRKVGYDERISFEGKWQGEFAEAAPACVSYLREAWAAAGRCESS